MCNDFVGHAHGLIIFPDSYTHPAGVSTTLTGINANRNTSWDANRFNADEWALMEAAGCVFLPAAGYRDGTAVSGFLGRYWSSTPHDEGGAYDVGFARRGLSTSDNHGYAGESRGQAL